MVGVSTKGRSTMYKLGMIGNFESLDPLLEAVYHNDTDSIEQLLSQGVSLNTPIELSHNIKITPLELAIITNNVKLCSFLIDHGASLEVYGDSPLFLTALIYGSNELISLFLALSTKLSEDEKFRAFNEVYWSNKIALIDILEQAGLSVAQYGGQAFRKAVAFNNEKLARVFLQKGVDVNFHEKDMVFPNASTPIIEDQLKILWDFFNHTILHQNKSTIYFDASNNFYKTLCMRCLNGTAISFQTLNKNNVHKSIKILNAIPGPLN